MHNLNYPAIAAFGAAFVATLILAAFLTPASWWKRPNVRALSVMVIGTWAIGTLLAGLVQSPAIAAGALASGVASPVGIAGSVTKAPMGGIVYRAYDDLNIRAGTGTGARRLAVVPAGAVVTATGEHEGDWWQVRTRIDGKVVQGWSSSLWLRRADE